MFFLHQDYAKEFGLFESQVNEKINNVDEEDEIPPGCEELLSSININPTISLPLKQHNKSALIG